MTQKFSTLKMFSTLIVMCLLATSFAFAQQPAKPATAKPATAKPASAKPAAAKPATATSSQTAKPAAAQTETKPAQTTQSAAPAKTSFQQSAATSTKVNQTANTTHEYVDLGLPSGLLWATCNVGANSPEDFGDYFAWGETKTKTVFSSGEKFEALFNKYNGKSAAVLASNEDAANANWGGVWRMPTEEEFKELNANCTLTWTSINGKNGCKVTGKNGKSIFLPVAGRREDSSSKNENEFGYYMASNLYENGSYGSFASVYVVGNEGGSFDGRDLYYGLSVRPVNPSNKKDVATKTETKPTTTASSNNTHSGHEYVDLGLPSGNLWATCNVGANKAEERGNWYAWGETKKNQKETAIRYWEDYPLGKGNERDFIRYNNSDGLMNLKPEDDAANVNWGGSWKMPNQKDFEELIANCTWEYIRVSEGNEGIKGTAKNGNSIYLHVTEANIDGFYFGHYWTSPLSTELKKFAVNFYFERTSVLKGDQWGYDLDSKIKDNLRKNVASVRPIYNPKATTSATSASQNTTPNVQAGNLNGHEYVNLGLPSGTLWATCNVGAKKPHEKGEPYAWAETKTKTKFTWDTYTSYSFNETTYDENFAKYSDKDGKKILEAKEDAATTKWGSDWRTPTKDEFQELLDNCNGEVATIEGVKGYKMTSKINQNYIFLPHTFSVAQNDEGKDVVYEDFYNGDYWTASLHNIQNFAYYWSFNSEGATLLIKEFRFNGYYVRPVCAAR